MTDAFRRASERRVDHGGSVVARHPGFTIVEFALVLPLFLILLAAIIDFGILFFVQHTLQFATREELGSRWWAAP